MTRGLAERHHIALPAEKLLNPTLTSFLEWVAVALFFAIPLADISVGVIALMAGLSTGSESEQSLTTLLPGMAVRGALLLLMALLMWRQRKLAELLAFGLLVMLLAFTEALALLPGQNLGNFIYGVSYAFKISLIVLVFLYVISAAHDNLLLHHASAIIRWSFAAYSFAVAVGHLTGFEYTTYGGMGSSGLMIKGSSNSISLIMLVGSPFVIDALVKSRSTLQTLWWGLVFLTGFYSAALLLTKGAMLGVLLPTIAYVFRWILNGRSLVPLYAGFSTIFCTGVVALLIDWSEIRIVKRTISVLDSHGGDILGAIFSGRLTFFAHGWSAFTEVFKPYQWIFGAGAAGAREAVGKFSGIVQGVESDFLDFGLVYGLLGFCIAVGLWLLVMRKAALILCRPAAALTHILAFNIFLLTSLSVIAGHVLTSGLGGAILGLAVGLLFRQQVVSPARSKISEASTAKAVS